jgi:hypothetical protein
MWFPTGARYMLNSTSHWQRLVQGFSGAVPDSYRILHHSVQSFPSDDAITRLRERGAQYVIVHEEFYGTADYHSMIRLLETEADVVFVSGASDGRFESRIHRIIVGRQL